MDFHVIGMNRKNPGILNNFIMHVIVNIYLLQISPTFNLSHCLTKKKIHNFVNKLFRILSTRHSLIFIFNIYTSPNNEEAEVVSGSAKLIALFTNIGPTVWPCYSICIFCKSIRTLLCNIFRISHLD